MSTHELKLLQTRLTEAELEFVVAKERQSEASKTASEKQNKVNNLKTKIAALTTSHPEPVVSEHALLRFVERVYGVDLSAMKNEILSDNIKALIDQFQTGRFPIPNYDCVAVVKNRVIVTIETKI